MKLLKKLSKPETLITIILAILALVIQHIYYLNQVDKLSNGKFDKVYISDILDFVEERKVVLAEVVKKLRYGGVIEIHGIDIYDLCNGMQYGRVSAEDFNKMVLGKNRRSLDTIYNVVHMLSELGIKVLDKRINNWKYFIRAERPDAK